jgi:hypothetical protein
MCAVALSAVTRPVLHSCHAVISALAAAAAAGSKQLLLLLLLMVAVVASHSTNSANRSVRGRCCVGIAAAALCAMTQPPVSRVSASVTAVAHTLAAGCAALRCVQPVLCSVPGSVSTRVAV